MSFVSHRSRPPGDLSRTQRRRRVSEQSAERRRRGRRASGTWHCTAGQRQRRQRGAPGEVGTPQHRRVTRGQWWPTSQALSTATAAAASCTLRSSRTHRTGTQPQSQMELLCSSLKTARICLSVIRSSILNAAEELEKKSSTDLTAFIIVPGELKLSLSSHEPLLADVPDARRPGSPLQTSPGEPSAIQTGAVVVSSCTRNLLSVVIGVSPLGPKVKERIVIRTGWKLTILGERSQTT